MNSTPKSLNVFISYSHDDDAHKEWVLRLANKLIENDFNVELDQFYLIPGVQFESIIERKLLGAHKIVLVCTPKYFQKTLDDEGGVAHEFSVIRQLFKRGKNIIPIIRSGTNYESVPLAMQQLLNVDFTNDNNFDIKFQELLLGFKGVNNGPPPVARENTNSPDIDGHLRQAREYFNKALDIVTEQKYDTALELFNKLKREMESNKQTDNSIYNDVLKKIEECSSKIEEHANSKIFDGAVKLIDQKKFSEASAQFKLLQSTLESNGKTGTSFYKDIVKQIRDCSLLIAGQEHLKLFQQAQRLKSDKKYPEASDKLARLKKELENGSQTTSSVYADVIKELEECAIGIVEQEQQKEYFEGLQLKNTNVNGEAQKKFAAIQKVLELKKATGSDLYIKVVKEIEDCKRIAIDEEQAKNFDEGLQLKSSKRYAEAQKKFVGLKTELERNGSASGQLYGKVLKEIELFKNESNVPGTAQNNSTTPNIIKKDPLPSRMIIIVVGIVLILGTCVGVAIHFSSSKVVRIVDTPKHSENAMSATATPPPADTLALQPKDGGNKDKVEVNDTQEHKTRIIRNDYRPQPKRKIIFDKNKPVN